MLRLINIKDTETRLTLGEYLTSICSGVQLSRFTDLTRDMWTPKFLCIPAQRIHINMPMFQEAHLGPKEEMVVSEGNKEFVITFSATIRAILVFLLP